MGKAVEKVKPGRKRARFTKEFKLEAVRLLEAGSEAGHADCVGIGYSPPLGPELRLPLVQLIAGAFRGPGAKPLAEYSEVERLRRELKRVSEERDILKKAAAYFAKELP